MNIYKSLRQKNGLTQVELAKKLNINQATVSKWEKGKSIPDIMTLKDLSNLFEVSIETLLVFNANNAEQKKIEDLTPQQTFMIGEKIKEYRKKRDLSQRDFAKLLKVANGTISLWENNLRVPDLDTIKDISAVLEVPIHELLGLENTAKNQEIPEVSTSSLKHNQIKELRKEKNITQNQLATAIGVSRSSVAMWETNNTQPDFDLIKKLADYFGVSIDYILGYEIKPTEQKENLELTSQEKVVIEKLKKLSNNNLQKVLGYIDGLLSAQEEPGE